MLCGIEFKFRPLPPAAAAVVVIAVTCIIVDGDDIWVRKKMPSNVFDPRLIERFDTINLVPMISFLFTTINVPLRYALNAPGRSSLMFRFFLRGAENELLQLIDTQLDTRAIDPAMFSTGASHISDSVGEHRPKVGCLSSAL